MTRTGIGFDFHRLVRGRRLVLGGVEIPHARGLQGHSDADVLLHAICDALLGAAGLEDIGHYFPDTDPRFAGVSSLQLLRQVASKIRACGYVVENIDSMLLMEAPRVTPYRSQMKHQIAGTLRISPSHVSVKATTLEGCGTVGRGEGIAAQAVATLRAARTGRRSPARTRRTASKKAGATRP